MADPDKRAKTKKVLVRKASETGFTAEVGQGYKAMRPVTPTKHTPKRASSQKKKTVIGKAMAYEPGKGTFEPGKKRSISKKPFSKTGAKTRKLPAGAMIPTNRDPNKLYQ